MRSLVCRTAASRGTGHLFVCPTCRAEARLTAALRRLPSPASLEKPQPISEDFLRRVTLSVQEERRRHSRRTLLLSLTAALLFFFLAGAGHHSGTTDTLGAEESYAQLAVAPSALESLLPE